MGALDSHHPEILVLDFCLWLKKTVRHFEYFFFFEKETL